MSKPNVLFIMTDQMRQDSLECNGNKVIKTPNFNRLAQSGVNFTNAFTPDPICVPGRACLTTGMYPHKCTGIKNNGGEIKEGMPLIAEEFNKRGYDTYAMGKLHYMPYKPPGEKRTVHGFKTVELMESGRMLRQYDPEGKLEGVEDYHDYLKTVGWEGYTRGNGLGNNDIFAGVSPIPEEHFADTWVMKRSIHYMEKHLEENSDKPFFMFTSFPKPHSAYDPPRPYDAMYDPRDITEPLGDIEYIKGRGLGFLFNNYMKYGWYKLSPQAKKVIRAHYYGLIALQDKLVGILLDFLEEKGILDNTIIVYTTDHGDMLGDFGLYFKQNFYNGAARIPMIISYPEKIEGGKVSDELAGLQDLLPTLTSLAGSPLDKNVDGCDLTPVLNGEGPVRDYFVGQCLDAPRQQYMVCSKEWKYIYHQEDGVEELYDLKNDPDELNNVAGAGNVQDTQSHFRNYLINWCIENNDKSMIEDGDLAVSEQPQMRKDNPALEMFGRRYY